MVLLHRTKVQVEMFSLVGERGLVERRKELNMLESQNLPTSDFLKELDLLQGFWYEDCKQERTSRMSR